eukprot:1798758-Rhodomonas_salina.1
MGIVASEPSRLAVPRQAVVNAVRALSEYQGVRPAGAQLSPRRQLQSQPVRVCWLVRVCTFRSIRSLLAVIAVGGTRVQRAVSRRLSF